MKSLVRLRPCSLAEIGTEIEEVRVEVPELGLERGSRVMVKKIGDNWKLFR